MAKKKTEAAKKTADTSSTEKKSEAKKENPSEIDNTIKEIKNKFGEEAIMKLDQPKKNPRQRKRTLPR